MKRKADITSALAVAIWLAIAWEFRDHPPVASVPLAITVVVMATAFACHRFGRWYEVEASVAALSFFAIMPFFFASFGGV